MELLTAKSPGVLPCEGHLKGRVVILRRFGVDRLECRKKQLHLATGGNGCHPDTPSTGVYMQPLWVEDPKGSGKLRAFVADDELLHSFKGRRAHICGIATPELVAEVANDTNDMPAGDPDDLCVIAACDGSWAKGNTVAEALAGIDRKTVGRAGICVVHRECWLDETGYVMTPRPFIKEGRELVQWVSGRDGVTRKLPAAERLAAKLIAAARK